MAFSYSTSVVRISPVWSAGRGAARAVVSALLGGGLGVGDEGAASAPGGDFCATSAPGGGSGSGRGSGRSAGATHSARLPAVTVTRLESGRKPIAEIVTQ